MNCSCLEKMSESCGNFYGTSVSTSPDNGISLTPSRCDHVPNRHMPGSTPVYRMRNDGAVNEKLDRLLTKFTEQKQENAQLRNTLETLSSQVSILQDQVSNNASSSGTSRYRVPPALSVSCCMVACFILAQSCFKCFILAQSCFKKASLYYRQR